MPMRDRDGGVDPRQAVESVKSASRFMRDHGIKTATGRLEVGIVVLLSSGE
jgi:hypothetical protein